MKQQVAALRARRGQGDDLDEAVSKLEECVEHHAGEEENEMFPRVQELMPEERRMELGRRLQASKRGGARQTATPAPARSRTRTSMTAATAGRRRAGRSLPATARKTTKRAKTKKTGRGRS